MKKFLALALFALVATASTSQSFFGFFGGGCSSCGYAYAPVYTATCACATCC